MSGGVLLGFTATTMLKAFGKGASLTASKDNPCA